jgi:hypothetical protein
MGAAKRRRDLGLGATGEFPEGMSRRPGDEGELRMAVSDADSEGNIHMDFGKEISWIAFPKEGAIALARMLLRKAGAKKVEITF